MLIMGTIAAAGHFLIAASHAMATASRLAPPGYLEIAAAIVLETVAFGNVPSATVWIGIVLIAGSGLAAARQK